MRKSLLLCALFLFASCLSYAEVAGPRVLLLIAEQNIEGPQRAWWASEIDLSATEAIIAKKLLEKGYDVADPSSLNDIIKQRPAFRMVDLSEQTSVQLGKKSSADYLILGKAIATSGGNVPHSSMRSCFANITAKLIRVKDGKIIAYLDASAQAAHMDTISGGREALTLAGDALSLKILDALAKARGGN